MLGWQTCPKCKGKIHIDRDMYGWFVECITCGYIRDLEEVDLAKDNGVEIELKLPSTLPGDSPPTSG